MLNYVDNSIWLFDSLTQSRQVLAQQLSIGKALTEKVRSNEDSDEDEQLLTTKMMKPSANDEGNPWVIGVETSAEMNDFIAGYRKYWDDKNKTERAGEKKDDEKIAPALENPVESVTEEFEESEEKVYSNETVEAKKGNKKESSQKKQQAAKVLREPKKAGTSEWFVEPVVVESPKEKEASKKTGAKRTESSRKKKKKPVVDIDALFESMETKITSQIDTKLKNVKRKLASSEPANDDEKDYSKSKKRPKEYENFEELELKKRNLRPDLDIELDEGVGISGNQAVRKSTSLTSIALSGLGPESSLRKKTDEIDPNKFINVKPKHLMTMMPDTITVGGDEALDDNEKDEAQHNIISEAFADDDVVEEFRKEKAEEVSILFPIIQIFNLLVP